jgi:hypothetical protein
MLALVRELNLISAKTKQEFMKGYREVPERETAME